MAQAGFYRTLNSSAPDDVECFVCFITLSGWEANEEPFEEHNAHSPECPFAQARKPQDELKVGEWIEVLRVRNDKINVSQLGQCDNVYKSLSLSFEYANEYESKWKSHLPSSNTHTGATIEEHARESAGEDQSADGVVRFEEGLSDDDGVVSPSFPLLLTLFTSAFYCRRAFPLISSRESFFGRL